MHKNCYKGQYEEAEKERSFKRLLAYPCQLFRWQIKHPKDNRTISLIASHANMHKLCGDKCEKIEKFTKDNLRKHLHFILYSRLQEHEQAVLL